MQVKGINRKLKESSFPSAAKKCLFEWNYEKHAIVFNPFLT